MQCQLGLMYAGEGSLPLLSVEHHSLLPLTSGWDLNTFEGDIEKGYGIKVVAHPPRYRTSMPCLSEGNCKKKL